MDARVQQGLIKGVAYMHSEILHYACQDQPMVIWLYVLMSVLIRLAAEAQKWYQDLLEQQSVLFHEHTFPRAMQVGLCGHPR